MSKRMLLVALSAISAALFVLPAAASATPVHLDTIPPNGFTIHGPEGNLSTTSGATIKCTTATGGGVFTTTTTGTVSLTFDHCFTTILGSTVTCTSTTPAEVAGSGNISTTDNLVFHLITPDPQGNKPGILITPPAGSAQFAHFTCAGIQQTVEGKGVIGTFIEPPCNTASNSMTLAFERVKHGEQKHLKYTGEIYDLTKGGETAALETHAKITFGNGHLSKLVCT